MCNNVGENFYAMQYNCFQLFFSKDPLPEFSFQRIIDSYKSIKLDETHFLNIIGWELREPKETPEYCIKRNRTLDSELWLYFSFAGPMSGGKEILFNRLMAHIPTPTEDGEFIISSGRSHANRYSMTMQLVLSPGIYCTKKQTENSLKITCRLVPAIGEALTFRFREKTAEDDDEAQSFSYQIGYLEDDPNLTIDDFRQAIAPHLQRYDMSRLGKRQMAATLKGLTEFINTDDTKLSSRELRVILGLFQQKALPETDDRSLKNRKVKLIGDFLFEVLDMAFHRLQAQVIERWQLERPRKEDILQKEDVAFLIPSSAMKQSIDSFFQGCELFQILDDPNPIAQISQKRRLTFRGPGGLPDNALLLDKRDVHPSDFGRVCPVESPQGADLGLNLYLAQDARINEAGLIEARLIDNSSGQETFIDPYDEEELKIFICAQQHNAFGTDQSFVKTAHEELRVVDKQEVTHHCPSPGSFLGYAASLIPFFQHNDANRALMGANMMKQALPLADLEPPLVKTGYEATIAQQLNGDNPFIADDQLCLGKNLLVGYLPWDLLTYEDAVVISRRMVAENTLTHRELEEIFVDELKDPNRWEIITAENEYLYDENGNIIAQAEALDESGVIKKGTRIENGTVLVSKLRPKGESLFFEKGEFNNRDKQERLFKKINEDLAGLRNTPDVTSPLKKRFKKGIKDIHALNQLLVIPDLLDLYNVIIAEEKTVFSEIVNRLIYQTATCRKQTFSRLTAAQQRMIIRLNRYLLEALYPKDAPLLARKKSDQSDRDFITLLMSSLFELFEDDLQEMKDESVYAPRDMKGIVQDVEWITDCLPQFVIRRVRILIETEHSVQVGDKLTGRHGNKGVVSRILPEKEMPYFRSAHRPCIDSDCVVTETHTHLDMIINPLTITSRMNLGQLYETTLGWLAAHDKEHPYVVAPFANDWTWSNIAARLKEKKLSDRQPLYYFQEGKETAIGFSDGIHKPVTVGYQYFLKLKHLSEHKLRARDESALNPSLKQPTVPALPDNPSPAEIWGYRKARQKSAQRLGEMEVWALEGHSAWNILDELLFLKSDADSLRHILIQQTIGLQGQGKKAFKIIDDHKGLYSWRVEATGSGITVTCTKGESEKELEKFAHDLGLKISPSGDNQYLLTYAPFDVYEREHQAFKTFVWYCRALGLEVEGINQDNRHIKLVGDAPHKWPKLSGIAMRIASDKE